MVIGILATIIDGQTHMVDMAGQQSGRENLATGEHQDSWKRILSQLGKPEPGTPPNQWVFSQLATLISRRMTD